MHASRLFTIAAILGLAFALPAQSAMYKWVDENGNVGYGDSVPPKYVNKVTERSSRSGSIKWDRAIAAADTRVSEQESEKQRNESKGQQERKRLDTALLSTYASETEIDLARERELRRNQESLKALTAGLASSSLPEDRQRLDALMNQSRKETDAINTRFDAQKARFRELMGPPKATQASAVPAK